jgi:hypothetical protein
MALFVNLCCCFADLTESGVDNESEYEEMPHHHHLSNNINNNKSRVLPHTTTLNNNRADHGCSACVTVISVCPSPSRQKVVPCRRKSSSLSEIK